MSTTLIRSAPSGLVGSRQPAYSTPLGQLYLGDCLDVLPHIRDECVDTIFADPPFNLGKHYGSRVDDRRGDDQYLEWCYRWLPQHVRVLKPGGAFFLYNLPRWNIELGHHLGTLGMRFRHWIAICQRSSLPIRGRLYPAHYSLLYYTKGKPKTFRRIRTPIELCRHCQGELRDYGGHRDAMNAHGVNLMDVWCDIPPVRHRTFKSPDWTANALSTRILERVVELTTRPGDLVLDAFCGSGTTAAVCERRRRRWIGVDIEPAAIKVIVDRLTGDDVAFHQNDDFVEDE
jgi:site-specific DNA-methyltransferase (adenine-specific)